jgi:hypothetical protein
MEAGAFKVLKLVLEYGALGVLAFIGYFLYFRETGKVEAERKRFEKEREEKAQLTDKLYELSREHLKSDQESAKAYAGMERIMDGLLSVLKQQQEKHE